MKVVKELGKRIELAKKNLNAENNSPDWDN